MGQVPSRPEVGLVLNPAPAQLLVLWSILSPASPDPIKMTLTTPRHPLFYRPQSKTKQSKSDLISILLSLGHQPLKSAYILRRQLIHYNYYIIRQVAYIGNLSWHEIIINGIQMTCLIKNVSILKLKPIFFNQCFENYEKINIFIQ